MFLQLSNTRKISTLVALYSINSRAWHNLTFLLCRRSCAMQCQWARSCHSKWLHNDFLYRVEGAACIRHTYFSLGWCWWVWHLGKFELCNFGLVLFCSLQGRRLWPAMGEFCKLGQNLGCKSCFMLLLLLLALHHSGLEGSQLWGSQLACRLALFQSYYCLTDELLGHSILGIEHHWLLGQSVFSCISCMIFYLLERNSQSPAEANYLIWYSCEDWGVWEDELIFTWSLLGSCSGQFIQRLPWFLLNVKYIIPNVFVVHHGLKSICPVPVLSQLTDHCWQQFNVCLKGPAGCKLDFLLRGWIQFSWFAIVP